MRRLVAAHSITELSCETGEGDPARAPAPKDLLQKVIDDLDAFCAAGKDFPVIEGEPTRAEYSMMTGFERKIHRARKNRDEIKKLIANPPNGFEFATVLYARITPEQKDAVRNEYHFGVYPRFMRFLAAHHKQDLRALGICENGIDRMSLGMDPADKDGVAYRVSVDHLIECGGAGIFGQQKSIDPLAAPMGRKAAPGPTYEINHFRNFHLVTDETHQAKNLLNAVQQLTDTPPGKSCWAVMLVPKRDENNPSFVEKPTRHAQKRPCTEEDALNQARYLLKKTNVVLEKFYATPKDSNVLYIRTLAPLLGKLTEAANDQFARIKNGKSRGSVKKFAQSVQMLKVRVMLKTIPTREAQKAAYVLKKLSHAFTDAAQKPQKPGLSANVNILRKIKP